MSGKKYSIFILIVASFGYFVDAVDLIVASLVRNESIISLNLHNDSNLLEYLGLKLEVLRTSVEQELLAQNVMPTTKLLDTGVESAIVKSIGIQFETWQSWGLLLGGLFFGVIGDKLGRQKALYGSIALYSICTILNGMLQPGWSWNYHAYCLLRMLSGFGLAAEFGIAITIVTEVLDKERRTYGTMLVASIGLLGCVFAASLVHFGELGWRSLFFIGGILGLILLVFRFRTSESEIFKEQAKDYEKGNILTFFRNRDLLKKLVLCILIGLPAAYMVGLPMKFAQNFGTSLNIEGISIAIVIITFYIAVSVGDIICNFLSQILRTRRIPLLIFNSLSLLFITVFAFIRPPQSAFEYEFIYCPLFGFSIGSWALIATTTSEQFGTNIRATATASVPNFIRSSFIIIAAIFISLDTLIGSINAAGVIGISCSIISIVAVFFLRETFGEDLNYSD